MQGQQLMLSHFVRHGTSSSLSKVPTNASAISLSSSVSPPPTIAPPSVETLIDQLKDLNPSQFAKVTKAVNELEEESSWERAIHERRVKLPLAASLERHATQLSFIEHSIQRKHDAIYKHTFVEDLIEDPFSYRNCKQWIQKKIADLPRKPVDEQVVETLSHTRPKLEHIKRQLNRDEGVVHISTNELTNLVAEWGEVIRQLSSNEYGQKLVYQLDQGNFDREDGIGDILVEVLKKWLQWPALESFDGPFPLLYCFITETIFGVGYCTQGDHLVVKIDFKRLQLVPSSMEALVGNIVAVSWRYWVAAPLFHEDAIVYLVIKMFKNYFRDHAGFYTKIKPTFKEYLAQFDHDGLIIAERNANMATELAEIKRKLNI